MKSVLFFLLVSTQFLYGQDTIKPGSNLITQGIPPIPTFIADDVLPYSESRAAAFCDWNPTKKEMIISTRFGNVNQLHVVNSPLGSRKQLTFFNEPITNAQFDPINGHYFLFTKDIGGNEFAQIYRYDLATGKSTLLTDGKRSQNGGIKFSNSGKWIAYGSTSRNGADRDIYIMDPTHPASNKMLLSLSGGGWGVLDWSPNDDQLLLLQSISANESHYWLVNVKEGTKEPLTPQDEKQVAYGQGVFSKNQQRIYFTTDKDNEFTRLAYMDVVKGTIQYLSSSIKWGVTDLDLSEDGKQLAFTTNEDGLSMLYMLNTTTNQFRQIKSLPTGVYSGLSFHKNGIDVSITINNAQSPSDVFVYNSQSGKYSRWTESETGGIPTQAILPPSLIQWKSFDDKMISGFMFSPPKSFAGKRPVIINIHGGPEGQSLPTFQGANNYYLNEMGVVIIYPNVRGSTGYGKTFLSADNGFKREESVKDIGALLDWIAQQPQLDKDRIMVMGGSYGGYMTLAVSTFYSSKIKCAIDVVGISNFNTFLKNTESYRRDLRRVEYGDERDPEMATFLEKISPLNHAEKIKHPLFIVQGGNDPRVPRTEAAQMAEKIRQNNGVVWYLEAKDEGHGFRKKTNIDFQRNATILFMRKYLLGD